jgi:integrase
MPALHFHDLRHTSGTLLAEMGVTLKESMRRLGHSSPRAALRYQDAVEARDKTAGNKTGERLRQAMSERSAVDPRAVDA